MSKRTLYVLTGLFLFVLFTLSSLPLVAVLNWAKAGEQGLRWQKVDGTLWYGTVSGAVYDEYPIGTVRVKTYLFPLVTGRVSSDLSVTGPALAAGGRVSAGIGGTYHVRNTALLIDLGQYNIRDAFDAPMAGTLRLDIEQLDFVRQACRSGDFRLWTDSLVSTAKRYGGSGFPLAGRGRCENGELVLPVAGKGSRESVELQVNLSGNLDYRAEVRVQSSTPDLVAALRLYGFDTRGDQLVMIQRGNLLVNP